MNAPQGWVWNGQIEMPGQKEPVQLFVELFAFVNLVEVLCWAGAPHSGETGEVDPAWPMTAIGIEVLPRITVNPRGPLEELGNLCVTKWKDAVRTAIAERALSLPEIIRATPASPS